MFTQGSEGRNARAAWPLLVAVMLLTAHVASGQTVNVSVTEESFRFEQDSEITVEVTLDNAQTVAGIDVVLQYPVDRFLAEPTWENGDLFGFISVNPVVAPPGELVGQVNIAAADAEDLSVQGGVLIRLTFPVPCAGNDVPGGQDLLFTFGPFLAYDSSTAAVAAEAVEATINLRCGPVTTDATSFGTVKAFFSPDLEIR